MSKLFRHLKLVRNHRWEVLKASFKMGIFAQGLLHDLSKYSIAELKMCKYYTGKRSPHAECRSSIGYSPAWAHHYQRNKHHWEHYLDIADWPNEIIPIKIPYRYIIEMFCDFIAAGKTYNKENWTVKDPLNYWTNACEGKRLMYPQSEELFKHLIYTMSQCETEQGFYDWYHMNKSHLKSEYRKEKTL